MGPVLRHSFVGFRLLRVRLDGGEGNDYTSMSTVYQYYYWTEPIDAGRSSGGVIAV